MAMGYPGGKERHCPSMQGWVQESQSPAGVETIEDVNSHKKGFCKGRNSRRKSKKNVARCSMG